MKGEGTWLFWGVSNSYLISLDSSLLTADFSRTVPIITNLALRGRATQSSTYYNYNIGYLALAANSNDGNLDSNYYHGSCSLTGNDMSPWWRVDLLQPNKISQVVVTNRGNCCSDGLNGALILIGDSLNNNGNNNPSCSQITYIGNGATLTFECNGMVGRFVNIVRPGMAIVQLCEIQVNQVLLPFNTVTSNE
uniref:Fucolectin tachylectin-4 pentraxin-1 domain-containing protein n=1 Tax=Xenopus tropicalis TaxID=8364 RepID=A0A803K5C0_XENTR